MLVQVNTDNHVKGSEGLAEHVREEVESTLSRFGDQLTRVEVSLNDVNGHKQADNDKRCMMEAKLAGMPPVAVTHQANTIREAIDGAAEKLERMLDHKIGKLSDGKGRGDTAGAK